MMTSLAVITTPDLQRKATAADLAFDSNGQSLFRFTQCGIQKIALLISRLIIVIIQNSPPSAITRLNSAGSFPFSIILVKLEARNSAFDSVLGEIVDMVIPPEIGLHS